MEGNPNNSAARSLEATRGRYLSQGRSADQRCGLVEVPFDIEPELFCIELLPVGPRAPVLLVTPEEPELMPVVPLDELLMPPAELPPVEGLVVLP
jgi:hypothetical protein